MKVMFIPSVICMLTPLIYLSFTLKGEIGKASESVSKHKAEVGGGLLMLILGVGALISVPIFKTLTHLPPYIGMLFGLGIFGSFQNLYIPNWMKP